MTTRSIAILFLVVLLVGSVVSVAMGHDPYSQWKDRRGYGCCDNRDCRPTRAYVGEDGRWRALADGKWLAVPPDAVLAIPSPDGRSHICITPGAAEPMCFVPGEPRS